MAQNKYWKEIHENLDWIDDYVKTEPDMIKWLYQHRNLVSITEDDEDEKERKLMVLDVFANITFAIRSYPAEFKKLQQILEA